MMNWWKRLSEIDWEVVAVLAVLSLFGVLLLMVMAMGVQVPFVKE